MAEEPDKGCDTEYLIHVVTGSHSHAGNTDSKCNVYVSIVGMYQSHCNTCENIHLILSSNICLRVHPLATASKLNV